MQLLTTAEAAAYLRLKERKIYEMVAEGTVPCTKVTGRWLSPKAELDHWLASSVSRPDGMACAPEQRCTAAGTRIHARVPGAAQREALAERCAADPGPLRHVRWWSPRHVPWQPREPVSERSRLSGAPRAHATARAAARSV